MDNDELRGAWDFTGSYWMCDCPCGGPLLNIGPGQGGPMVVGKRHSPTVSRCQRCDVLRPLKRDRPELTDALPHGIVRVS